MDPARRWKFGCLILVLLFLLGAGILSLTLFLGPSGMGGRPGGLFHKAPVAVVPVEGVIYQSRGVVEKLTAIQKKACIKAVVIRLNTPGGVVAPSQEIYEAVKSLRRSGKRVVASMAGMAASGGYYIACAADTIVANPGSITGSIGVIMQFPYLRELYEKIGVKQRIIKSGKHKDAGSPHRPLTKAEKRLYQNMIDDTHQQFVDIVAERRNLSRKQVLAMADGRLFNGRQAFHSGFVDILGTLQDAKRLAKTMAGLPESAEVLEYRDPPNWIERFFGSVAARFFSWTRSEHVSVEYRFRP